MQTLVFFVSLFDIAPGDIGSGYKRVFHFRAGRIVRWLVPAIAEPAWADVGKVMGYMFFGTIHQGWPCFASLAAPAAGIMACWQPPGALNFPPGHGKIY